MYKTFINRVLISVCDSRFHQLEQQMLLADLTSWGTLDGPAWCGEQEEGGLGPLTPSINHKHFWVPLPVPNEKAPSLEAVSGPKLIHYKTPYQCGRSIQILLLKYQNNKSSLS